MIVVRETIVAGVVAPGTDKVLAWAPIPEGGKLLSVTGELHVLGLEEDSIDKFHGYGFSGELIPVVDPDAGVSLDTMWDYQVTKPADASVAAATTALDFDWDTSDTGPDVEPGQADLNQMLGLVESTKKIIEPVLEIVSFPKQRTGSYHEETSGDDQWVPTDYKTFRSERKLVSRQGPSFAMLAFSSPTMDEEETSPTLESTVGQWGILGNLDNVLNDMWKMNAGLTDVGAIAPYLNASNEIEQLVAPDIVQPADAILSPTQWTVLCKATWLLDFPSSTVPRVLKGESG